jgi:hypothetical protein
MHELSWFWRNPHDLVDQYTEGLHEASGGAVTYQVVEWRDLDTLFPFTDGFRYTPDQYMGIFDAYLAAHGGDPYGYWSSPDWHACPTGGADYAAILAENDVLAGIASGAYDEVHILAPPMMALYESRMIGPNAIWCNSPPMTEQPADREFLMVTLGWEREVGCALEDLGHASESMLSYIFSQASHANTAKNYWQLFTKYDATSPGQAACGNVHWAPNSESDYDWGNSRYVVSTCDDWLDFPHLDGATRSVNRTEWGGGDMALHHLWWFSHFGKAEGLDADGMLYNWWGYTTTFLTGY